MNVDRYLEVVNRARMLYASKDGSVVTFQGYKPSPYTNAERKAFDKYMVEPAKVKVAFDK